MRNRVWKKAVVLALLSCLLACCAVPGAQAEDFFTLNVDMLDMDSLNQNDYVAANLSAACQGIRVLKTISTSSELAEPVRLSLTRMDTQTLLFDKDYGYQSRNFDSDVIDRIRQARLAGNTHFMIIVAEGAGSAIEIGKGIHEELGLDPRVTILGHIQRGGTPSARDRVMASRMGYQAVKVLAEGKTNRVVGYQHGRFQDFDIDEALAMVKGIDPYQYQVAKDLSKHC